MIHFLALYAAAAVAQAPTPMPAQAPRLPASAISGIQVQRAAPAIQCADPDVTTCAHTDAERRSLLISFYGRRLTDEQALRLVAGLEDVNAPNETGADTPLTAMIAVGNLAATNALLARGADPMATDAKGGLRLNRALEWAYAGSAPVRPEVRDCLRAALERATRSGRLPERPSLDASLAFRSGADIDLDLLRLLLDYRADPLYKGKQGRPLDRAAQRPDVTRQLVTGKVRVDPAELDARAYRAFAERKPDFVEALRAGGGDPDRYARAHPELLYDAVGPGRPIEVAEMLLRNGADPNASRVPQARMLPLFATGFEREKIRLLLKYGADPNAKDASGYTLLAHVLFNANGQVAAPKVEMVQLLLDAGTKLNADHGGWGRAGALGLARREEPQVIAYLVGRGATLSDSSGHGPVSIAIETERDDLALALLARDGKVASTDRAALPLAVRRGWSTVVTALIAAGADVNATDEKGVSALALAERRRDAALMKTLLAAGAKPGTQPARPALPANASFASVAAREIDDIVFFDPPRFLLGGVRETSFAFYGDAMNDFREVKCERNAGFEIVAMANIAGGIRVGVCTAEARRVRELAAGAQPVLAALLGQMPQAGTADRALLAQQGWTYAKSAGVDGAEEHFFALIAIGHGVLSAPTVVLVPRRARQAIVVQADTMQLCENYGLKAQTPLCSDPRQALTGIARRLAARYAD